MAHWLTALIVFLILWFIESLIELGDDAGKLRGTNEFALMRLTPYVAAVAFLIT